MAAMKTIAHSCKIVSGLSGMRHWEELTQLMPLCLNTTVLSTGIYRIGKSVTMPRLKLVSAGGVDLEQILLTSHDCAKEKLVAPNVVHPLREIPLGTRLHAEE
jgi:hypothetical protein